ADKEQAEGKPAVTLMTMHNAKGLEFPVVFIPRCVDKSWGNKREFSKIKLPPNLIHFQKEHDAIEDERRLFYVAVTRAKNKVIVSYARQYGSGEQIAEKQPSQFIDEASGNIFKGELQDELSVNNNLDFLEKALKPVPMADSEVDFLQTKLQDYKLSVTNLETYLNCPAQFKWAHLYQLPKAKNKYMALGTAFHFALEKFFTQFHDNQRLPDKQVLLDEYKNALEYEVLSHQEYEEMLGIGFDGLGGYFDNWQNSMTAPLAAELNFSARQVMFGDARITGKIDKIEPLDNDKSQGNKRIVFGQIVPVRVVDYKTGKVRTENEIMGKTKSADLAMFRQILFYRILTRQDYDFSRRFEMAEGQIDFVQGKDGVYKKINVPFGADDITNMEQTITDVWNKIMSLDFTPLPEKQKCEACPYRDLCQAGKLITND
ncbi:MAG: PD-(D/E)XK nuclease family protein, partial [Patescibacteria group bacterium]|nr:PD-(D/E)XK nuclease family protein [Patescibacteria group bacterium]